VTVANFVRLKMYSSANVSKTPKICELYMEIPLPPLLLGRIFSSSAGHHFAVTLVELHMID
jgi:hypothetical protein